MTGPSTTGTDVAAGGASMFAICSLVYSPTSTLNFSFDTSLAKPAFGTVDEADYTIDLKAETDVGVLQSKDWFQWDDETHSLRTSLPISSPTPRI
ncbi:hypothetical protein QFC24_006440 [Naganishia onofrii]|uniref:Uncharacterized protein n=1 Tax=Naganishia onofrii TaxID=1851511 RepID=A0ACC2X1Q7_9TREE|nr:hypothetical protein QFC24_006440 [Naganishia onofrii]